METAGNIFFIPAQRSSRLAGRKRIVDHICRHLRLHSRPAPRRFDNLVTGDHAVIGGKALIQRKMLSVFCSWRLDARFLHTLRHKPLKSSSSSAAENSKPQLPVGKSFSVQVPLFSLPPMRSTCFVT